MISIVIANKTDFPLDVNFTDEALFSFVVYPLTFRTILWNKGIIKLSFSHNENENIIEKYMKYNTIIEFDGTYKTMSICGVENCKNKVCVLTHPSDINYKICVEGDNIISNKYKKTSTMSPNSSNKQAIHILLHYMSVEDLVRYVKDMGINIGNVTVKSSIIEKVLHFIFSNA